MKLGRNVAICGKITNSAAQTTTAIQKGMHPLKIILRGTSGEIDFTTQMFKPSGGEITPISQINMMMTPYQIGSKPSFKTV